MNKRLGGAMLAYVVLAGIAFRVLDGKVLYAVLILFGGLAAKTLISAKRDQLADRDFEASATPSPDLNEPN